MTEHAPDTDTAQRFLNWLEPEEDRITFQLFADSEDAKAEDKHRRENGEALRFARIRDARFADIADELADLNSRGAGVYFTVNRNNGRQGRNKKTVREARALFLDLDGSPLEPVLDFAPRPQAVVETSKGRYHCYWRVADIGLEEWTELQEALAYAFNGDPVVHDWPRVSRLPGFYHRKNGHQYVRLVELHEDDAPVTSEQMRAALADALQNMSTVAQSAPDVGRSYENVPELKALAERDCDPRPDSRNPGRWYVRCPWSDEHSAEGDGTDTVFIEAHTNGYAGAGFLCMHAHCQHRDIHELRRALGIVDNSREAIRADARKLDKTSSTDEIKSVLQRAAGLDSLDREEIVEICVAQTKKKTTAIRNQMKSVEKRRSAGAAGDDAIDRLNDKHAIVRVGGKTAVMTEFRNRMTGQLDITFSNPGDMRSWYSNDTLPDGTSVFDAWMESERRRQYQDIVFEPGRETPGEYNLWHGFTVDPDPNASCRLLLSHIHEVICGGDDSLYDYVVAWMADAVQNPETRPGVSLVLRGGRGTGKGIVSNTFGSLFGQHFVPVYSPRHLTGNFNAHLKYALVVFADEAFWAGDKSAEGVLKGMVTEPSMAIESKNWDPIYVPNRIRLLIASNEEWVVPAGLDERRFVVLDVSEHRKGDFEYFNTISEEIKTGGREALLHFLMNYDLSSTELRDLPQTVASADQKLRSADPAVRFWYERLQAGSPDPELDTWSTEIRRERVYVLYQQHCQQENVRGRRHNREEFGRLMAAMCPSSESKRKRGEAGTGKREYWSVLPDLETARREFEAYLGGSPIDWPDPDEGVATRQDYGY